MVVVKHLRNLCLLDATIVGVCRRLSVRVQTCPTTAFVFALLPPTHVSQTYFSTSFLYLSATFLSILGDAGKKKVGGGGEGARRKWAPLLVPTSVRTAADVRSEEEQEGGGVEEQEVRAGEERKKGVCVAGKERRRSAYSIARCLSAVTEERSKRGATNFLCLLPPPPFFHLFLFR